MEIYHTYSILSFVAFHFFLFNPVFTILKVYGRPLSIVDDFVGNITEYENYIVHVQKPIGTKVRIFRDRKDWYMSFLPNTTLDSGEPRMTYTYRHAISGFAARLTKEEVEAMAEKEGFLLARQSHECLLRTTYSPEFLGLSRRGGMWYDSGYGQGQIIAVLDSGIKYDYPSFDAQGMPPPPPKWKGSCYWSQDACNNKLIGAIGFHNGKIISPLDADGHGTHTASTAAGNFVDDAEVLGNARGTASGLAPRAYLAAYKVTSPGTFQDVVKGIDKAIEDQVDVLSMSIGPSKPLALYDDDIAIGSFAAMTKGIVPCQAAGNAGGVPSIIDGAPWILTVGASTTDRRLRVIVKLGDGREFYGESAYHPDNFTDTQLPLVSPGPGGCDSKSLNSSIKGKIVICGSGQRVYTENVEKGEHVKKAGGEAMIILSQPNQGNRTDAEPHVLPASRVTYEDAMEIMKYYRTASKPTASLIFNGTIFGFRPTPTVWAASSRGPSLLNGNILKPDVIAPGVNIVAAWPTAVGPNATTGTKNTFMILSGTSMAAPHVSGIVALLKHNHPTWSPAAIKSAIMTTAYTKDRDGNPIMDQFFLEKANVFAIGSGHVDPIAANEPGLIYDIQPHDYIRYLCGMKFSDKQVSLIVRGNITCSQVKDHIDPEQLNYPAISVYLGPNSTAKTINRMTTNVGDADSTYTVDFDNPKGVNMDVHPNTLHFNQTDEKKTFSVTFSIQGTPPKAGETSEGQLSWNSGKYFVRCPIVVTFT